MPSIPSFGVLHAKMIIAEVSDKIPTLSFYWIQMAGFIAVGLLFIRISSVLCFGYAMLLLIITGWTIHEFNLDDPFYKAVKAEKGISYIIQSWLTIGLSGLIVLFISIRKIVKERNLENKVRDQIAGIIDATDSSA